MTNREPGTTPRKTAPATLARLRAVVEAYGAAPARWPAAERARLERLAGSHAGASWMEEARDIDRLLDLAPGAALDEGAARRIVAAAQAAVRADPAKVVEMRPRRIAAFAPGLGQAALLAASLAAGFWIGANDEIDTMIMGDTPLAALAITEEVDGAAPVYWWTPLMNQGGLL